MSKILKSDAKRMQKSRTEGRTSGIHKRFNRASFEETKGAVDAVALHLESLDLVTMENDDRYGPDLVRWTGFKPTSYIEVAQRSAWKEGEWPDKWDPVNIEERKLHLWKLGLPCDYWVVCKDLKNVLVITDAVIDSCMGTLEVVPNRTIKAGEKFIRIPLELCMRKTI